MRFFFDFDPVGRDDFAREDKVAFVDNGPLNFLAFGKVHSLSNGGGEVDIPLLTGFALDQLNFSWAAHGYI